MDELKVGDEVEVSRSYPVDRDHPFDHVSDLVMHGLLGTVIGMDKDYYFVQPLIRIGHKWPKKEPFDPEPHWHFKRDELKRR